ALAVRVAGRRGGPAVAAAALRRGGRRGRLAGAVGVGGGGALALAPDAAVRRPRPAALGPRRAPSRGGAPAVVLVGEGPTAAALVGAGHVHPEQAGGGRHDVLQAGGEPVLGGPGAEERHDGGD